MTRTPIARSRHCWSTPGEREPEGERADDEGTEGGADQPSTATEEAGATDDDSGDAVEVGVGDPVRRRRARAADLDPRREAVDQAGHGVDAEQDALARDTGQAGRLRVVTDREEVPAPGGLGEGEPDDGVEHQDHDDADGDPERADRERLTGQVEDVGQPVVLDARATGVQQRDRGEDRQRA